MPLRASQSTVQDCWNQLGYTVPSVGPTDPNFLSPLNLANQGIIDSGSWEGCVVETFFDGSLGYLTLPSQMQSIVGVDIKGWPQMVFGRFHQYMEVGPGLFRDTLHGIGPLFDVGDGFCTQTDIPDGSSGVLRIKITNVNDAGKIIRFEATGTDGQPIYDSNGVGFNVTTVNPTKTDTNTVTQVTAIQIPVRFISAWTLWWVSAGVETQIGQYLPNELRPNYHRYKTGTWQVGNSNTIACLCRLRWVPLYSPTDFVRPGNMNAIKFALQAVNNEASSNYQEAQQAWQQCYRILNDEHKSRRGKAQYGVNFNPHGSGQAPVWNVH